MKKQILLLSFLISIVSFSCKKIDKFTKFDMEFNNKVTIPSNTGIDLPFNISTPDVSTNSEYSFSLNWGIHITSSNSISILPELNSTSIFSSRISFATEKNL